MVARPWLFLCIALAACSDAPPPVTPDSGVALDASDGGATDAQDAGDGGEGMVAEDAQVADSGPPIIDDCDPVLQTGCPAAQKCVVEGTAPREGTRCVPTGAQEFGLLEPCAGLECAPGLVCVGTSSVSSICQTVCNRETGAGCPSNEQECLRQIIDTNWGICVELPAACAALSQNPCLANEACQPFRHFDGDFDFRCRPAGLGVQDDTCGDGCARNHACVRNSQGETRCQQFCANSDDCPPEAVCSGTLSGLDVSYCITR